MKEYLIFARLVGFLKQKGRLEVGVAEPDHLATFIIDRLFAEEIDDEGECKYEVRIAMKNVFVIVFNNLKKP